MFKLKGVYFFELWSIILVVFLAWSVIGSELNHKKQHKLINEITDQRQNPNQPVIKQVDERR